MIKRVHKHKFILVEVESELYYRFHCTSCGIEYTRAISAFWS